MAIILMAIQIPHPASRAPRCAPHLAQRPGLVLRTWLGPAPRIVFKDSPLNILELENDADGELPRIILNDRGDAEKRKRAAHSRKSIMILNYSRTPFILLE